LLRRTGNFICSTAARGLMNWNYDLGQRYFEFDGRQIEELTPIEKFTKALLRTEGDDTPCRRAGNSASGLGT
jgi:hypothetical protein